MDSLVILVAGAALFYFISQRNTPGSPAAASSTTGTLPQGVLTGPAVPPNQALGSQVGSLTSGILSDFTATANIAGPVGTAVSAVVSLIAALRSTAHLTANQFVQQYQNPFAAQLSQVADWNAQELQAGTQTVAGATNAYNAIVYLWQQFQQAATAWAGTDATRQLVVRQGLNTLNGPNGDGVHPAGLINTILSDIQANITQLRGY